MLPLCAFALLGHGRVHAEIERFAVGSDDRQWADWGTSDAIDDQSLPGWIQARRTTREVNLLREFHLNEQLFAGRDHPAWTGFRPDQDARIWSPNIPPAENSVLLLLAEDGRLDSVSLDHFNRLTGNAGVTIFVDLGIPFPVSEISFYPLDFGVHADLFIKGYELAANDGSPGEVDERGELIFSLLDADPLNPESVVRNNGFPPQHIRYIRLTSTSPQAFELDQLEIRGEGYVRRASFTSHPIDLGDLATFGRVVWASVEDPGSHLTVQTRIGRDETTLVYHQINELGEEVALEGASDDENRRAYDRLPAVARGAIEDDTENWTLWSAPYRSSGQEVVSAGPGRFIQFRLALGTDVPEARSRVDSIAFEFSRPVLGRRIMAQITPRDGVDLGSPQTFIYAIRPDIGAGDTGFDIVELSLPTRASLKSVRIGDREIPETDYEAQSANSVLTVRLLKSEDRIESSDDELVLVFDTSMLIYGTFFGGQVSASWEADLLPQRIEEESVGDLVVLGTESSLGHILGRGTATPAVFTPNADGVNDFVSIAFRVSQMIGEAPLQVRIYDLASRLVATLADHPVESDNHQVKWYGLDDAGRLVLPGLYIYQIALEGDTGAFVRSGTVAVAY